MGRAHRAWPWRDRDAAQAGSPRAGRPHNSSSLQYVRGALEVGDVDLAVEFDQTKDEAGQWFATRHAGGFDHLGALRRELRGNQRALEIHFIRSWLTSRS